MIAQTLNQAAELDAGNLSGESSAASRLSAVALARSRAATAGPNLFSRWAFYLSAFSIPFVHLYVPGTGDRVGIIRLVQMLLLGAAISQPRICLRRIPQALLWFVAYCAVRIVWGLWLAPDWSHYWWPTTLDWIEFSLPWVWIIFNLLQWPQMRRTGLWAFALGASFCAMLHVLGVGVTAVDNSVEEARTTIFADNANNVGAIYAAAIVTMIGLGMFKDVKLAHRLFLLPLIGLLGIGLAKTGSRTAVLIVAMGTMVLLFQAEAFSSRAKRYVTLAMIGVVLAAVVWQQPTVVTRFEDLDSHNIGRLNPRARMAPVLWEMFMRSPIYGSGPDQYQFELTRRAMPYLIRDQRTIVSHNLLLLLLVETGVLGLFIFSMGVGKALAAAWRARAKSCGYLPLALLLPFLVAGLTLANPATSYLFWFVLAYALGAA